MTGRCLLILVFTLVLGRPVRFLQAEPAIVKDWIDLADHGAAGDGKTKDTSAIQAAIDTAGKAGGGTAYFPPGTYLSGTLHLKSKVTLHLEAGATLLGSTEIADYPPIEPAYESYTTRYVCQSLIYGANLDDVAIVGRGVIDGQGATFKVKPPDRGYRKRPYVIRMTACRNTRVEGITLRNSPMWMQHYLACDNVTISGITVRSRCNANNDGLNIDCCKDFHVSNCSISSGDDAIVLKSTSDRPCENVTVTNCALSTNCSAIKLGTESNGGFKNIAISNCALYEVGLAGLALELVDGGVTDGVVVSNITMRNVGGPIFLRLGNRARPYKKDMDRPGVGTFGNVIISNINATGCGPVGSSITGLEGHPVKNVSLSNIKLTYAGGGTAEHASRTVPENASNYSEYSMFGMLPAYGFYCRHVEGLTFNDVDVCWKTLDHRSALVCDDVKDLAINGLKGQCSPAGSPMIVLNDVVRALIRGCSAPAQSNVFLRLHGKTDKVSVTGCNLSLAAKAFECGGEISPKALYQSGNQIDE